VRLAHLLCPHAKRLAGRRVLALAEEPRLDDGGERGGGHVAIEHLLRVVPPHAALWHATANQDDVTLVAAAAAQALHGGERVAARALLLVLEHAAPGEGRRRRGAVVRARSAQDQREEHRVMDNGAWTAACGISFHSAVRESCVI